MALSRRKFLNTSVASGLGIVGIGIGGHAVAARQAQSLRVMTYNIGHARGTDGIVSVHRIAHEIRKSGAQVIALQEVDVHWGIRSDFRDQARELADLLDMHLHFSSVYSFDADFDPEGLEEPVPAPEGVRRREFVRAVLSSYPMVDTDNHEVSFELHRGPNSGEIVSVPGLPEVTINLSGTHVRVFSVHLDAGRTERDANIRATQVGEILEIVGQNPSNMLIMGDLNGDPNSGRVFRPEIAPLFTHFDDAWAVGGTGDGFTYPSSNPDVRIDYILVSPDVSVDDSVVIDSLGSDHRPVVADLRFGRRPRT